MGSKRIVENLVREFMLTAKASITMIFVVLLLFNFVKAYEQSHPLSQIHPIDVNLNMYGFNVTNTSYVGIGTVVPEYPLDVYGSGRFTGNLYVGGTIYGSLNGEITAGGNLNMMGYDIYNASNLNATNLNLKGFLSINGVTVINSNRNLVGVSGVKQNLVPGSNNAYELGSSSARWKTLWANALDIYTSYTHPARLAFLNDHLTLQGLYGDSDYLPYIEMRDENGTRAFYLGWGSKTGKVVDWRFENGYKLSFGGNVYPASNNTYNLGTSSKEWANIYAVNGYFTNIQAQNINGGSPVTGSGSTNYIPIWTGVSTLGNSIIYQANSQAVGIGTTSPENSANWNRVLELYGDNHARFVVGTSSIRTVVTSHNFGFYGAPAGGIIGTETAHSISFITNGTSRVIIDSSGNVGIGTIHPQTKLDVAGNVNASAYYDRDNPSYYLNPASTSNVMSMSMHGTLNMNNGAIINVDHITINDPGAGEGLNFGGTSASWVIDVSPLDRSNNDGNLNLYGTANNIVMWRPVLIAYNGSVYNTIQTTSSGNLAITGGSVGIGTSSPGAKLEVAGNLKINQDGTLSATNGNLVLYHPTGGGYSAIVFPSRANYGSDYGYIKYEDDDNNYNYWGDSVENSALVIGVQNDGRSSVSDVVVLKSPAAVIVDSYLLVPSGNVGIGTTSPSAKLDVSGTFKASSNGNNFEVDPEGNVKVGI